MDFFGARLCLPGFTSLYPSGLFPVLLPYSFILRRGRWCPEGGEGLPSISVSLEPFRASSANAGASLNEIATAVFQLGPLSWQLPLPWLASSPLSVKPREREREIFQLKGFLSLSAVHGRIASHLISRSSSSSSCSPVVSQRRAPLAHSNRYSPSAF